MKKCNKCKQEKPDIDFPARGNQLGPYCLSCKREYDREYWSKTKSLRNDRKKINVKDIRYRNAEYVFNYLKKNPCVKCGENNPLRLTFDHLDPTQKKYNVSEMRQLSLDNIISEIKKCRVLCASCHLEWTAQQRNTLLYQFYRSVDRSLVPGLLWEQES